MSPKSNSANAVLVLACGAALNVTSYAGVVKSGSNVGGPTAAHERATANSSCVITSPPYHGPSVGIGASPDQPGRRDACGAAEGKSSCEEGGGTSIARFFEQHPDDDAPDPEDVDATGIEARVAASGAPR